MEVFEQPAPRLGLVLHYVIARTAGCGFGAVKLNKAIFAADTEFYRRYGRTITGAVSYQKQKLGPVPNGVVKELKRLQADHKVAPQEVITAVGPRKEFSALVEPDVAQFDAQEVDVMNVAITGLERLSANAASDRTHDALWDEVELFGQVPVKAAAFTPVPADQEILAWALSDEA